MTPKNVVYKKVLEPRKKCLNCRREVSGELRLVVCDVVHGNLIIHTFCQEHKPYHDVMVYLKDSMTMMTHVDEHICTEGE